MTPFQDIFTAMDDLDAVRLDACNDAMDRSLCHAGCNEVLTKINDLLIKSIMSSKGFVRLVALVLPWS